MTKLYDDQGNARVPIAARDWMKAHGGSFLARLAGLYEVADQANRNRILQAFLPEFLDAHYAAANQKGLDRQL